MTMKNGFVSKTGFEVQLKEEVRLNVLIAENFVEVM